MKWRLILQEKQILEECIRIIDSFESIKEYDYELDDERNYLSWIQSRQLF